MNKMQSVVFSAKVSALAQSTGKDRADLIQELLERAHRIYLESGEKPHEVRPFGRVYAAVAKGEKDEVRLWCANVAGVTVGADGAKRGAASPQPSSVAKATRWDLAAQKKAADKAQAKAQAKEAKENAKLAAAADKWSEKVAEQNARDEAKRVSLMRSAARKAFEDLSAVDPTKPSDLQAVLAIREYYAERAAESTKRHYVKAAKAAAAKLAAKRQAVAEQAAKAAAEQAAKIAAWEANAVAPSDAKAKDAFVSGVLHGQASHALSSLSLDALLSLQSDIASEIEARNTADTVLLAA